MMVALTGPENVREAGWDELADVLKMHDSWHGSVCLYRCLGQDFDSGCFLGLLNIERLCSLSDTSITRVDGVKYSAGVHSPFCRVPSINNQELNALLPDRVSGLDARMVKEMSSPTHSGGGAVLFLARIAVWQKSQASVDTLMYKPMQKEGQLLQGLRSQ